MAVSHIHPHGFPLILNIAFPNLPWLVGPGILGVRFLQLLQKYARRIERSVPDVMEVSML
jgi:hypothetical protein